MSRCVCELAHYMTLIFALVQISQISQADISLFNHHYTTDSLAFLREYLRSCNNVWEAITQLHYRNTKN